MLKGVVLSFLLSFDAMISMRADINSGARYCKILSVHTSYNQCVAFQSVTGSVEEGTFQTADCTQYATLAAVVPV